jgi:hypothetical protein
MDKFRKLEVWISSKELVVDIYNITNSGPLTKTLVEEINKCKHRQQHHRR